MKGIQLTEKNNIIGIWCTAGPGEAGDSDVSWNPCLMGIDAGFYSSQRVGKTAHRNELE